MTFRISAARGLYLLAFAARAQAGPGREQAPPSAPRRGIRPILHDRGHRRTTRVRIAVPKGLTGAPEAAGAVSGPHMARQAGIAPMAPDRRQH